MMQKKGSQHVFLYIVVCSIILKTLYSGNEKQKQKIKMKRNRKYDIRKLFGEPKIKYIHE